MSPSQSLSSSSQISLAPGRLLITNVHSIRENVGNLERTSLATSPSFREALDRVAPGSRDFLLHLDVAGLLESFSEEEHAVQLQLLTATVKLFLKQPNLGNSQEMHVLTGERGEAAELALEDHLVDAVRGLVRGGTAS